MTGLCGGCRQRSGASTTDNHRVAKGHLPSEFALQFVEIDHGQLDLYVIDDLLFVPLGRGR